MCLQEGLKYCREDTHPEGWGELHQSMGDAHYIQGKGKPNYRTYWLKAVKEYRLALKTLTPKAFPELHLKVVQKLIKVLFGLGKDTEAKQWRQQALEVLQKQFNNRKTTSAQKRRLVAAFSGLSQMRVDILVADGYLVFALEWAELTKNLYLTDILDAHNQHIFSRSYQEIQQPKNLGLTGKEFWHKFRQESHHILILLFPHNQTLEQMKRFLQKSCQDFLRLFEYRHKIV